MAVRMRLQVCTKYVFGGYCVSWYSCHLLHLSPLHANKKGMNHA